jgi:hypothetical protein
MENMPIQNIRLYGVGKPGRYAKVDHQAGIESWLVQRGKCKIEANI